MKHWRRLWKIELIERFNPTWADLRDQIETWRLPPDLPHIWTHDPA
jgi:hypothetical protein